MTDDILLYEVKDTIAFITMNRPEKQNALNTELSLAIRDAWVRFENDDAARVAIFSGRGKSFCAGADIAGGVDASIPYCVHQSYPLNGVKVFKPIVGAIHGLAVGAGYALAVRGCDFTIAGEGAQFLFPESRVGVGIVPQEYTPYMPFKASLEFLLLAWRGGRPISARRGYELGFVNEVVADDQVMNEAIRWAEMLKQVPPLYIKSIKYGHYQAIDTKVRVHEREYLDFVWPQLQSSDRQEGIEAFREKRAPKFTGR